MKAIELLKGASERVVRFKYLGKTYSGIRISARRNKEASKLQASRWGGIVADVEIEIVELPPCAEVEPVN